MFKEIFITLLRNNKNSMVIIQKTVLIIGDECDFEAFMKIKRNILKIAKKEKRTEYIILNYKHLLKNKLPEIKNNKIITFFLFPFDYWNNFIEPKNYKGVYGNIRFYTKFLSFCNKIKNIVEEKYHNKEIYYINPPENMYIDRDKNKTKEILKKNQINVPETIKTRSLKKINQLIKKENLFLKVTYGAMGKGITYLTNNREETNFRFKQNKIISKKTDYGWDFIDIKDKNWRNNFLKKLLKEDITIEKEIKPLIIDNKKFDLRLYVSFGKVIYIYPRTNKSISVTTNISQGGKGELQTFLNKIPTELLEVAKKEAIKATKTLNLKFAGIDVMFDEKIKKPIILEVNCFPGFPKSKTFNLSKIILNDIKNFYKNEKIIPDAGITIKKSSIEELNKILPLKLESKEYERKINPELQPIEKVRNIYRYYLEKDLKGEWRAVFTAKVNGEYIGIIIGKIYRSLKVAGYERRCSISNLYVKPRYRKKGIANKLIDELVDWMKEKKVQGITLSVYPENRFVDKMYERMGFKPYCKMLYKKLK
jgi:glutathione synthase/RimK-type ligase-like ATP-grasp enzyme/GNAT superfamily N-acetyltransferase